MSVWSGIRVAAMEDATTTRGPSVVHVQCSMMEMELNANVNR